MEFIGRRLPYSHDRPEVALSKLATAGLVVVSARLIETGGETFYWIVARKPVAQVWRSANNDARPAIKD